MQAPDPSPTPGETPTPPRLRAGWWIVPMVLGGIAGWVLILIWIF